MTTPNQERYAYKHPLKRQAAHLFDALGSFYRKLRPAKVSPYEHASIEKILLIRLDHLGDVVMTRPAIDAVRAHYPKASIDLLISADAAPLFSGDSSFNIIPVTHHWFSRRSSLIQQITEMEDLIPMLRRERYSLGIDFRGDLRHIAIMALAGIPERVSYGVTGGGFLLSRQGRYDRSIHQVDLNMKLLTELGIETLPQRRSFQPPAPRQKSSLFDSLEKSGSVLRIIVHPGAGRPEKRWARENFQVLIKQLLKIYPSAQIILIGTREEKGELAVLEDARIKDFRGKTKVEDLPGLFELSHLYIGNDSGPAHLAAFQGMAGIIIFNEINDPKVWRPWAERFQVISHSDLETIGVDQVIAKIDDMLETDKSLARLVKAGK